MDVTYYVGIGIAIGSAIGGTVAGIVSLRKQKYTQAKDEFRILIAELKEDREKKEERISKLEIAIDECKENHRTEKMENFRQRQEIELLKKALKITGKSE